MRTSIVSVLSALVIAGTAGTAMASSQVPSLGSGESAAMAGTYSHLSQPLDSASASHRAMAHGLTLKANGQSAAMAESFANTHQPLERTAYSSNANEQNGATAFLGRSGHSDAMEDTLANVSQPLNAHQYGQANDQVAANDRI